MKTVDIVKAACETREEISVSDLAARAGVTRARIYGVLRDHDLTLNKPSISHADGHMNYMRTGGLKRPEHYHIKGTVAELLVTADLVDRGYSVYMPATRHCELYDLIICPPVIYPTNESVPDVLKVEVKVGTVQNGSLTFSKKSGKNSPQPDIYAVVAKDCEIIYFPELPIAHYNPEKDNIFRENNIGLP